MTDILRGYEEYRRLDFVCSDVIRKHFIESKRPASLNSLCRDFIRKRLVKTEPHTNLFCKVSQLPLTPIIKEYLLHNKSVEVEDNSDDDGAESDIDQDSDTDYGSSSNAF